VLPSFSMDHVLQERLAQQIAELSKSEKVS
jgi:hypothetical protein